MHKSAFLTALQGVGKTLTAEAGMVSIQEGLEFFSARANTGVYEVAETMHVPLYVMGAGELGIKPRDVDDNLEKALQRCTAWDAVLLLDEAEIFLQSRDMGNLMRNELVSSMSDSDPASICSFSLADLYNPVFLRHLEYYQGNELSSFFNPSLGSGCSLPEHQVLRASNLQCIDG